MRVIVVGAGIVGVTSAYCLSEAGCTVTVLERNPGVAQETSFGNAGILAPSYVSPWAAPGMPQKILAALFRRDAPVVLRPTFDPDFWRWAARWLKECELERYRRNRERMQRLAFYSLEQMHRLRARHALQYEQNEGYLQLFRTERDRTLAQPSIAMMKEQGTAHRLLTPAECRQVETGLSEIDFCGGLHLPQDESGNCPLFARQLKDLGVAAGIHYQFNVTVRAIEAQQGKVRVDLGASALEADAVVIAAGVESNTLLKPLGLKLMLYPVRGYAATVVVKEPTYAPNHAVMDEAYKVAITRMGNRIRIAGTAELGRNKPGLNQAALATLIKVARDWFPGAADYSRATYWSGARPMLPDGPPVLGATSVPGVFVNLGHGSTGWAMACGSARVLADVVTQRPSEIDLDGLTIARYA